MSGVPFDTLKLAKRLEAGGFTAEQADTMAFALADAASATDLVTKTHLDDRLTSLEQRLTIRLGGMLVVAVGVVLTAIRYLPVHS